MHTAYAAYPEDAEYAEYAKYAESAESAYYAEYVHNATDVARGWMDAMDISSVHAGLIILCSSTITE